MKAYRTYLFAVFSLLIGCDKTSDNDDTLWYDFNGSATLDILYSNSPKEQLCNISAYKMFPETETNLTDTLKTGSGKLTFKLPASWPQKVKFSVAGYTYTMLLLTGSELTCRIDLSDPGKTTFEAPNGLAAVNDYIFKKELPGSDSFRNKQTMAVQSAPDLEVFMKTIDVIHKQELSYFDQHKTSLPKWFQDYEYWNIVYGHAVLRLNSIPQRAYAGKVNEKIPGNYYEFLKTIEVDNSAAKNSDSYYMFLYELFNKDLREENFADCNHSDFLNYQLCRADKSLSDEVKNMFKAFTLQNVYNYYKKDIAWHYLKSHKAIFSNSAWTNQLEDYFLNKENNLPKNQSAPNFVLSDPNDSLISLRSLKGNVVVLSFWFAGCKPCIEEFPAENAMVKNFKNRPVKIVSICVKTTEENWRLASKKFNLKTINLWANPEWEKTLIKKYDLYGFPKYVLIDPDQKIVDANASRPTQTLTDQINVVLTK
ncbi:MAG TPA: TlpA disulfide reductase family protein [Dyadobacter sp.]|jgi:peroxiredoxin|nr:TlpA disulfide reductase family protein [Dyadobacter sp.]